VKFAIDSNTKNLSQCSCDARFEGCTKICRSCRPTV